MKNFIEIETSKLVKADWNYKEDNEKLLEKLKSNIKRNGQIENIIIRELDTGFFEVVNGNHRFEALKQLGIEKIIAYNLGKITLSQAQRIAIETNETRFETDRIKLGETLKEISSDFLLDDLEKTMPFNEEELKNLVELVDFDWDQYQEKTEEINGKNNFNIIIVCSSEEEKNEALNNINKFNFKIKT